jgi:peptidoglycan/LPS O-acetylase OafA/YrhL
MSLLQSTHTHLHPKYRADIDGLRGIAVLLVVGYHAFPLWLPGGFIGVDVFFVISGFLISNIIFQNICQNSFSFVDFYCRRVRRIFPALIVVFACCYAIGWFVLLPHEYKQLGKHIVSGAGFVSNFVLWNEAGYFDNTAITKPLLHLWSLGIEEQFYIVWPLIVWAAYKKKIDWLLVVSVIAIGSFVLNLWLVDRDLTAAFYSPATRIWELLLGALIAHRRCVDGVQSLSQRNKALVSGLSVCVLVLGVVLINKDVPFPGAWALLPTLATAGLIAVGPLVPVNRIILSNRLLVWCGWISFPLYLWHWPLLSFARIIEGEPLSTNACWVIVMLSILLAWVTYAVVEKPVRYGARGALKVAALVGAMLIVGYGGFNIYDRDGLTFRGPQIVGKDRGYDGGPGGTMVPSCGLPGEVSSGFTCWEDSRPTIKFALVGDSKASAIHGGLVRTSTADGRWLFIGMGSKSSPLPIITSDPRYSGYQTGSLVALKALADNKQIEVVLIATSTRALFRLKNHTDIEDLETSPNEQVVLDGLQRVVDVLKNAKKKVVFLIDNPTLPHPEDCLPRTTTSTTLNRVLKQTMNQRCLLPLDRHLELSRKYRHLLMTLVRNNEGTVTLFDSVPFLCDQKDNICATIKDGRLLYGGTDHISDHAAGLIGKELNLYLQNILKAAHQ